MTGNGTQKPLDQNGYYAAALDGYPGPKLTLAYEDILADDRLRPEISATLSAFLSVAPGFGDRPAVRRLVPDWRDSVDNVDEVLAAIFAFRPI